MFKQRRESVKMYQDGGRDELAEKEAAEITVIEEFLPKALSETEANAAIDVAIAEAGATSIKDMGKVMAILKSQYAGQMDFGNASTLIKARLS